MTWWDAVRYYVFFRQEENTMPICVPKHPMIEFGGEKYYRDPRTGYFYHTLKSGSKLLLHRSVWEKHNGKIPEGFVVHHIDHDKENNAPSNLQCMDDKAHKRHHAKHNKWVGSKANLKQLASVNHLAKAWHSSPEGLQWHSENGKKTWESRKIYEMSCTVCGKMYETPYPTRSKYCHQNCKAVALRRRRKENNRT